MPHRMTSVLKKLAWLTLSASRGRTNSPLRVLRGPARGSVLNLDLRSQSAYWIGTYDSYSFDRIPFRLFVQPGQTAWDCGAYVGYYTAVFRKHVGSSGWVHAIEASSINHDLLAPLPRLNDWNNVTIHHAAVGLAQTEIEFVANFGGASGPLDSPRDFGPVTTCKIERVRCFGLDELLDHLGGRPPGFIKLDLEGAEVHALRNGARLFGIHRPGMLLEIHGPSAHTAAAQFMREFGYVAALPQTLPKILHEKDEAWFLALQGKAITSAEAMLALPSLPHMLFMIPEERLGAQSTHR